MTNFEKIKNMALEEMAECCSVYPDRCEHSDVCKVEHDYDCIECTKKWLESECDGA